MEVTEKKDLPYYIDKGRLFHKIKFLMRQTNTSYYCPKPDEICAIAFPYRSTNWTFGEKEGLGRFDCISSGQECTEIIQPLARQV